MHHPAMRGNNPLKLRRTGWILQGLAPQQTDSEYCQFINAPYGYRAAFSIIRLLVWQKQRNTVAKLLTYWVPDADGCDSQLYTARVCALTGFNPKDILNPLDANQMIPFVAAISRIENGQPARMFDIVTGWRMFLG